MPAAWLTTVTTPIIPMTSTEYSIRYSATDGIPSPGSNSPAVWPAASTPTRRKPACVTDEYASIRLTSVCTTARNEPTSSDKTASTQMTGRQSSRKNGNAVTRTRSIAANAAALPTDAMSAVTGDGAP